MVDERTDIELIREAYEKHMGMPASSDEEATEHVDKHCNLWCSAYIHAARANPPLPQPTDIQPGW